MKTRWQAYSLAIRSSTGTKRWTMLDASILVDYIIYFGGCYAIAEEIFVARFPGSVFENNIVWHYIKPDFQPVT